MLTVAGQQAGREACGAPSVRGRVRERSQDEDKDKDAGDVQGAENSDSTGNGQAKDRATQGGDAQGNGQGTAKPENNEFGRGHGKRSPVDEGDGALAADQDAGSEG
jgi:hypothetical protein